MMEEKKHMQYWEGAELPTLIINWYNKVACNTLEEKKDLDRDNMIRISW